jgi:hypothetical protein
LLGVGGRTRARSQQGGQFIPPTNPFSIMSAPIVEGVLPK